MTDEVEVTPDDAITADRILESIEGLLAVGAYETVENVLIRALAHHRHRLASQSRSSDIEALLRAVRDCRTPPAKGESVHGPYETGAGWNVSGLTALLPRIDAALKETANVG